MSPNNDRFHSASDVPGQHRDFRPVCNKEITIWERASGFAGSIEIDRSQMLMMGLSEWATLEYCFACVSSPRSCYIRTDQVSSFAFFLSSRFTKGKKKKNFFINILWSLDIVCETSLFMERFVIYAVQVFLFLFCFDFVFLIIVSLLEALRVTFV